MASNMAAIVYIMACFCEYRW